VLRDHSLVVPALLAGTLLSIGLLSALRRFPYGHWSGLRTRAILSSPAAWRAAHVAAAPWLLAGGAAGAAVCVLAACAPRWSSLLDRHRTAAAMGVEALFVVLATVVAQRAAHRVRDG
jgi:uncharacterized membrane protein